jgi:ATP-dependent Clp protease adaptor protein ClpS
MSGVDILEDIKLDETIDIKNEEPGKYKVVMLNDNSTPMDWVIDVLRNIFNHSQETASKIMLQIHNEGSAIVGIYNYEIAEQKAVEATTASRDRGFPLQLRIDNE